MSNLFDPDRPVLAHVRIDTALAPHAVLSRPPLSKTACRRQPAVSEAAPTSAQTTSFPDECPAPRVCLSWVTPCRPAYPSGGPLSDLKVKKQDQS